MNSSVIISAAYPKPRRLGCANDVLSMTIMLLRQAALLMFQSAFLIFLLIALYPGSYAHAQTNSDSREADTGNHMQWCSLPPSARRDGRRQMFERERQMKTFHHKVARAHDAAAFSAMTRHLTAMTGGRADIKDVEMKGHLQFADRSGADLSVPVVYRILLPGEIKVITHYSSGDMVYIYDGKAASIRPSGGKLHMLSMPTSLAPQMLNMPQLSLAWRAQQQGLGISAYTPDAQSDAVELLSPAIHDPFLQAVVPDDPVCIVFDRQTQNIRRIESFVHPENHPSIFYRQSVVYGDYRSVDGMQVPFNQEFYRDGFLYKTLLVDSVAFNVGVQAAEFNRSH